MDIISTLSQAHQLAGHDRIRREQEGELDQDATRINHIVDQEGDADEEVDLEITTHGGREISSNQINGIGERFETDDDEDDYADHDDDYLFLDEDHTGHYNHRLGSSTTNMEGNRKRRGPSREHHRGPIDKFPIGEVKSSRRVGEERQPTVPQLVGAGGGFYLCYLFECAKPDGFKCQFSAHNYYISSTKKRNPVLQQHQKHHSSRQHRLSISSPNRRKAKGLERPTYSKIITSPSNHHRIDGRGHYHDSHLASIRIGQEVSYGSPNEFERC